MREVVGVVRCQLEFAGRDELDGRARVIAEQGRQLLRPVVISGPGSLDAADLRCLDWLVDRPRSAGELSTATGLSTAATTTLIDRLERKGFVRRVRDAVDRRRVLVEMTPSGARRVGAYYGPLVREGSATLAELSDEQITLMRDWLLAARHLTDQHRERIGR